eukprot:1160791-Pelagomonas_calceolata.AAC.13
MGQAGQSMQGGTVEKIMREEEGGPLIVFNFTGGSKGMSRSISAERAQVNGVAYQSNSSDLAEA